MHKSLYAEQVDAAADAMINAQYHAQKLAGAADTIRESLDKLSGSLQKIALVDECQEGQDDRQRIVSRCGRLRELLNMMELGSFSLEIKGKMEAAYRRLP
jgi:hypothetical protein